MRQCFSSQFSCQFSVQCGSKFSSNIWQALQRRFCVLLALAYVGQLAGCSTVVQHEVQPWREAVQTQGEQAGGMEAVRLMLKSGESVNLQAVRLDAAGVSGIPGEPTDKSAKSEAAVRHVAWQDIRQVEQREISVWRTGLLVLGILTVVAAIAVNQMLTELGRELGTTAAAL